MYVHQLQMQFTNSPLFTAVSLVTGNVAHAVAIQLPSRNRYQSCTLNLQNLVLTAYKLLFIFYVYDCQFSVCFHDFNKQWDSNLRWTGDISDTSLLLCRYIYTTTHCRHLELELMGMSCTANRTHQNVIKAVCHSSQSFSKQNGRMYT